MRSDGTLTHSNKYAPSLVYNDAHAGTMLRAPPTAAELEALDAQSKKALDTILTGTIQSSASLAEEFPALAQAAEPFKTFCEPDNEHGTAMALNEAEKAIAHDKVMMDAAAERIYREAMRDDDERTEHLFGGTSGGRLSLHDADPPSMLCDNFVEETSDVEETVDAQLPAPPPRTVAEARPVVVRRGFLNRPRTPPLPPPPHNDGSDAVEPFRLEEGFDYDNCPLSAPPAPLTEQVLAWERDQFGPGGRPPADAMSSSSEEEAGDAILEEDLVDEGAE